MLSLMSAPIDEPCRAEWRRIWQAEGILMANDPLLLADDAGRLLADCALVLDVARLEVADFVHRTRRLP